MRRKEPAPLVPYWDSGYYGKAARRAAAMSTDAMLDWIGTSVSGMYKAMQDFRKDSRPESLQEMQEGLTAAYALLAELRSRSEGRPGRVG